MASATTHFQFTYNLTLIKAEKKIAGDREFYTLHFSNEVPSVTLQAIKLNDGCYEWDTEPPGNKELASSLGGLIEQHNSEHGMDETQ